MVIVSLLDPSPMTVTMEKRSFAMYFEMWQAGRVWYMESLECDNVERINHMTTTKFSVTTAFTP